MDPLSALSIAAATVQFFDFAKKVVGEYKDQETGIGAISTAVLEATIRDFAFCIDSLKQQPTPKVVLEGPATEHEHAIKTLAGECAEIAQELHDRLCALRPRVKKGKWTSFHQALKTTWQAADLKQLREKLDRYRDEIVIRLLACLNAKADASVDMIQRGNQEIIGILAVNHRRMQEAILQMREGGERRIHGRLTNDFSSEYMVSFRAPTSETGPEAMRSDFGAVTDVILSWLHFRQITDRFDSVKEAHKETLQWIFGKPTQSDEDLDLWSDFPEWLEEMSGCYWVQGKAGSGKSTLMKMICMHPRTIQHLDAWAAPGSLTVGSFFFWYLGSALQKSQAGLLRAILHKVLHDNPQLIARVMPELCAEVAKTGFIDMSEQPTRSELTRWFTKLAKACPSNGPHRICLFIDGLDEYVGDHSELAQLFLGLSATTTAIKFVLSSRPIAACVDAFGHLPSLRLQDLTMQDIKAYTTDLLRDRAGSLLETQEMEGLTDEIVKKSSGVFLWVCLVVHSLLGGIRDGDNLQELLERLGEMPDELEILYRHMFNRIPEKYQGQAAEMLQLITANFNGPDATRDSWFIYPFSTLQFSFALEKGEAILASDSLQVSDSEINKRTRQIEARIRSRCLGFLEVQRFPRRVLTNRNLPPNPTVELMHRTVMEFLGNDKIACNLASITASTKFAPHSSLFRSCLWMTRVTAPVPDREDVLHALMLAENAEIRGTPFATAHVGRIEALRPKGWVDLLLFKDHNGADIPQQLLSRQNSVTIPGLGVKLAATHPRMVALGPLEANVHQTLYDKFSPEPFGSGFALVALVFPWSSYLEARMADQSRRIVPGEATWLLNFLVHRIYFVRLGGFEYLEFSRRTVAAFEILLAAGADPNRPAYVDFSIWELFVISLRLRFDVSSRLDDSQSCAVESILKAFVMHDAELSPWIFLGDEEFSPIDLLGQCRLMTSSLALRSALERSISFIKARKSSTRSEVRSRIRLSASAIKERFLDTVRHAKANTKSTP